MLIHSWCGLTDLENGKEKPEHETAGLTTGPPLSQQPDSVDRKPRLRGGPLPMAKQQLSARRVVKAGALEPCCML